MLTHLSLFSGIGGIDIAAEQAGFETVCFVEIDPFCQNVLKHHWPDVPIIGDIKDVTREKIMGYAKRVWKSQPQGGKQDIRGWSFNRNKPWIKCESCGERFYGSASGLCPNCEFPITLITGGFPCQPFSVAGKQRGEADDRYLWPEMLRVIEEIRPDWVCGENVAGLIRMGLDDCLSDLEGIGYTTQAFVIPACAVNAPHRRDRVFIVAHTDTERLQRGGCTELPECTSEQFIRERNTSKDVADTKGISPQGFHNRQREEKSWGSGTRPTQSCLGGMADGLPPKMDGSWWENEPEIPRVATGVKDRVDRLKALGNAVVPAQIYPILKAIADTYNN